MPADAKQSPGRRERELFLAALDLAPAERAAFLASACGSDRDLRQRVEELLREQQQVGDFLEAPALSETPLLSRLGPGGTAVVATVTEKAGDRIGRYKLLQKIGEGGCGVVYMAEQEEPVRRRVALKVIKLGMDTRSVIARFEAERQALAMMEHPNIARVLDAGATETGRPFFVMELVRGVRITEYCDQNNLPTEQRLRLFIQVCEAIQHAHQKGIIHRDIKPSNILVTLHDGKPVPKVIDFGIAKATEQRLTEKTLFTEFSAFIGTPAYMSPEQAEMSGLDIDTRSDIYSLGVLLYELLIGRTPFDAETLLRSGIDGCRKTIREEEPVRPSTRLATLIDSDLTTTASQRCTEAPRLIYLLRGDLDWIAMKCLEKDRTRRYATANDLASDIQRYLDGEPVVARPPSNLYRLQKLLRRHRGSFAAAAAIALTLVVGAVLSTWLAVRARKAEQIARGAEKLEANLRQQAERDKSLARLNEYVADINLAKQSLDAGNYGRAVLLLNKHRPAAGETDLRGFEWRHLWQVSRGDEHTALLDLEGPVEALALSPGGELLALGQRDKLHIWNLRSRSTVTTLPRGAGSLGFLRGGAALLGAGSFPPSVRVWSTMDWTETKPLGNASGPITLSRDGALLATAGRGGIRVWSTADWTEQLALRSASGPMAFSPDGKSLAADAEEGITLWPLDNNRSPIVLHESTNLFSRWQRHDRALTFSPDGALVAAARNSVSAHGVFVLHLWDARTGEARGVMPEDPEHVEHTGSIVSAAFSPDGRTLATASTDYSIRLWDVSKRQRIATLQGHLNEVWTVLFSPDGQSVISGAKDGSVKIWPARPQLKEDLLPGGWMPLAFSTNSQLLGALTRTGSVVFLNAVTREPERQIQLDGGKFPGPFVSVSLSHDLRTLAQGRHDGMVKVWNTEAAEAETWKANDGPVESVSLSPDGSNLVTLGRDRVLRLWEVAPRKSTALTSDVQRVLFSPDGRTLAAFQRGDAVLLWDVPSRSLLFSFVLDPSASLGGPFMPDPRSFAAFSPDSRLLAIICEDDVIRLWDLETGALAGDCTGHKQRVSSLAFSPDGKTLATSAEDSTVKLWNTATRQELLTLRRLGGTMRGLLFSPDGQTLVGSSGFVSQSPNNGLRFYRAPDAEPGSVAPLASRAR